MNRFCTTFLLIASCVSFSTAMQPTEKNLEYYQRLGYLDLETIYTIVQQHCSRTDFRQFLPAQDRQGPVTEQWHLQQTAKKIALELLGAFIKGRGKIRAVQELWGDCFEKTIGDIEVKNYRETHDTQAFINKYGYIKFVEGSSLTYSFHPYENSIVTNESHEIRYFFNIFDIFSYGTLSLSYPEIIAFYEKSLGYNPQVYIDEHNNQKYQEWLKWRNQDPVGIFPEISASRLHQLKETRDHKNEEHICISWFPESDPSNLYEI